jgi:hypothetical protein
MGEHQIFYVWMKQVFFLFLSFFLPTIQGSNATAFVLLVYLLFVSSECINDAFRILLLFYLTWTVDTAVMDCDRFSQWGAGGAGGWLEYYARKKKVERESNWWPAGLQIVGFGQRMSVAQCWKTEMLSLEGDVMGNEDRDQ